ncbi:MAG: YccF domain-containing protein [bacterium]|nr:YccF domain-containing protein [bacterium]
MSLIGNILWMILGGFAIFLEYLISGFLLCCTIIGIPFGVQCMKLSMLALLPFGREVTDSNTSGGCLSIIMNIIWILIRGIWISLTHLVFAFLCAITIIGIPFASQHIKLAYLSLSPFGKTILYR